MFRNNFVFQVLSSFDKIGVSLLEFNKTTTISLRVTCFPTTELSQVMPEVWSKHPQTPVDIKCKIFSIILLGCCKSYKPCELSLLAKGTYRKLARSHDRLCVGVICIDRFTAERAVNRCACVQNILPPKVVGNSPPALPIVPPTLKRPLMPIHFCPT